MLRSVIDGGLHDHSIAARIGAIDRVIFNRAPFACRTPILTELGEGIAGVFRGVLLPVCVPEPDRIGFFKVLMFEGGEEFIGNMPLRIVAEMVGDPDQYERGNNPDDYQLPTAAGSRLIVLLSVH